MPFRTVVNLVIFLLVFLSWGSIFFPKEKGFTPKGLGGLKYFTVESNLLCGISCLCCVLFGPSRWTVILRFVATVSVAVTMLVVILLLGPMYGYKEMYNGQDFVFHMAAPLLAVVSFLLWEENVSKRELLWGALPVLLYGSVYLLNLQKNGMEKNDWYGFGSFGLKQRVLPVKVFWWIEVLLFSSFALLLAWLLWRLHT